MRMPTTQEVGPSLVVAVIMAVGELLILTSVGDAALAAGHMLKAAGGLGILFALYRLAPWLRGD
jgi:hypothetical protein